MIRRNAACDLVALCDILPPEKTGCADFNLPYFLDLEEMLQAQTDLDAVCICTPNGLHAQQAIQCLSAKINVVIEKPMALTKADCEAVIFKALNVNRRVFCVMQNRYSPPVKKLKEIVASDRLGDILNVQISCYWNRDDRYYFPTEKKHTWHGDANLDGGVLFTQFSHFLDILYWCFGDVKNIRARMQNFLHEHSTAFADTGIVSFDLVRGGMGSLSFSTAVWDRNAESSITVIGSRGTLKIGGQYMDKIEYCHIEDYELPPLPPSAPPNDYGHYKGSAANHHYVIQNVVDVLQNEKETMTNALEGMKVTEIIERIYAAV